MLKKVDSPGRPGDTGTMPLLYSEPKRLPGTIVFTQGIWDTETHKNYLAMVTLEEVLRQKRVGMHYALCCEVTKKVEKPKPEPEPECDACCGAGWYEHLKKDRNGNWICEGCYGCGHYDCFMEDECIDPIPVEPGSEEQLEAWRKLPIGIDVEGGSRKWRGLSGQ